MACCSHSTLSEAFESSRSLTSLLSLTQHQLTIFDVHNMDECKAGWGNLDTTNKYDIEWIKNRKMRHESETSSMICHEHNTRDWAAWYKQMRVSCTQGRILCTLIFLTAIPLLGIIASAMITSVRKREDPAETVSGAIQIEWSTRLHRSQSLHCYTRVLTLSNVAESRTSVGYWQCPSEQTTDRNILFSV